MVALMCMARPISSFAQYCDNPPNPRLGYDTSCEKLTPGCCSSVMVALEYREACYSVSPIVWSLEGSAADSCELLPIGQTPTRLYLLRLKDKCAGTGPVIVAVSVTYQCLVTNAPPPTNVVLRATFNVDCGGSACAPCQAASGDGNSNGGAVTYGNHNGPDLRIGLGRTSEGKDAGVLQLRATQSSANLAQPYGLAVPFHSVGVTTVSNSGSLTTVSAPQTTTTITRDATYPNYKYLVVVSATNSSELVRVTVENPDKTGASYTNLLVTEQRSSTTVRQGLYSYSSASNAWTLKEGATTNSVLRTVVSGESSNGLMEFTEIRDGTTIVQRTEKSYVSTVDGLHLSEVKEGVQNTLRTTSYT